MPTGKGVTIGHLGRVLHFGAVHFKEISVVLMIPVVLIQEPDTVAGCFKIVFTSAKDGTDAEIIDIPAGGNQVLGGGVIDGAVVQEAIDIAAFFVIDAGGVIEIKRLEYMLLQLFLILKIGGRTGCDSLHRVAPPSFDSFHNKNCRKE